MAKKILLFFTSLLFSLLLAETALRFVQFEAPRIPEEKERTSWAQIPENIWVEYHPVLGWVPQKNKTAVLEKGAIRAGITTNEKGFRGNRNYSRVPASGYKRVLMLGDSFVFGFGVEDHEAFSSVMESRFSNLEMPNLGVAGYGIDQIELSFKNFAGDLKADYVGIGIFPEDFWRATRAFSDSGYAKPYYFLQSNGKLQLRNVPVPARYQLKTNQFPEIVALSPFEHILMKSMLYRQLRRSFIKLGKNLSLVDPDNTEEWLLGRVILAQLVDQIRETGAKPFIVIIPCEGWMHRKKPTSIEKSIHRFAKREGVGLVDLTPPFIDAVRASQSEDYFIKDDLHWTPKGHRLAADRIAAFLIEDGLKLQEQTVSA